MGQMLTSSHFQQKGGVGVPALRHPEKSGSEADPELGFGPHRTGDWPVGSGLRGWALPAAAEAAGCLELAGCCARGSAYRGPPERLVVAGAPSFYTQGNWLAGGALRPGLSHPRALTGVTSPYPRQNTSYGPWRPTANLPVGSRLTGTAQGRPAPRLPGSQGSSRRSCPGSRGQPSKTSRPGGHLTGCSGPPAWKAPPPAS